VGDRGAVFWPWVTGRGILSRSDDLTLQLLRVSCTYSENATALAYLLAIIYMSCCICWMMRGTEQGSR